MNRNVLVIDDEERFRELLSRIISLEGFSVRQAGTVREGMEILDSMNFSVVVTDVKLPDGNGLQVLERIKEGWPHTEVIVITAFGTIQDGVQAMKRGAFDYITKGDEDEHINVIVERAAEKSRMQSQLQHLEDRIENQYSFDNIIGVSEGIQRVKELAQKVASSAMSVLLQGETGTGKELFAQAIHQASPRKAAPFVALNCSAFPHDLLESELFGFRKGAFTGARESKKGLLEEADTGTLFLDEIGEMQPGLQAKLLRVLENKTFTKLGETKPKSVDIRIISASNKDLKAEAGSGTFREDLYYRLAGFQIDIPPLRQRTADIPLLADFFLKRVNGKLTSITDPAMQQLKQYPWKGNIRELKSVIERAAILAEGPAITPDLLPPELQADQGTPPEGPGSSLEEVERAHIRRVLESVDGNRARAAEILQIGTSTLYRKIDAYNL